MLKKLFRRLAGGRAHPEIVFTCRGITSVLVINITRENYHRHRSAIYLWPDRLVRTGLGKWQLSVVGRTAFLAVVHNNILAEGNLHAKN